MRRKRRGVETTAESTLEAREELVGLMREVVAHTETSPRLTGGDIDADWQAAYSSGEESVGGSVATPDQDIVDEIGRALGVEQEIDAPVRASDEILRARDACAGTSSAMRPTPKRVAAGGGQREDPGPDRFL